MPATTVIMVTSLRMSLYTSVKPLRLHNLVLVSKALFITTTNFFPLDLCRIKRWENSSYSACGHQSDSPPSWRS